MLFHIKVASFLRIVPFEIPCIFYAKQYVEQHNRWYVLQYVHYFLGHNLNMYSFTPGHFRISRILLNKNARKVLRSTPFFYLPFLQFRLWILITITTSTRPMVSQQILKNLGRIGWNIFSKGILTRRNHEFLNCFEAVLKDKRFL